MSPKDSDLVIKFPALYANLKDWTDDDPEGLPSLTDGDETLRRLCSNLGSTAFLLANEERRNRTLFANPVDPKFVKAWRDYEARYAPAINCVELAKIIDCDAASFDPPPKKSAETDLKLAAEDANESANAISSVFSFAERELKFQKESVDDTAYEETLDEVERGISEWENLNRSGFDLKGIIRRRNLIPFVLIPRHVSAHHGAAEKLSLLTLLQQAQEAFVFGTPLAAISLMRAILEMVLQFHYNISGPDLEECINRVFDLPPKIGKEDLHELRS